VGKESERDPCRNFCKPSIIAHNINRAHELTGWRLLSSFGLLAGAGAAALGRRKPDRQGVPDAGGGAVNPGGRCLCFCPGLY
jgi:hypothetical protein